MSRPVGLSLLQNPKVQIRESRRTNIFCSLQCGKKKCLQWRKRKHQSPWQPVIIAYRHTSMLRST